MTYRKTDTGMWTDPWFETLSPNAKLAFIYLWTNEVCNPAGMYEISPRRIKFELGYDIDTVSEELKPKIEWYPHLNLVWVKNFFRHQVQNSKFATAALRCISQEPFKLQMFIEYNREILKQQKIDLSGYIDTNPIPYPTEQNRTETEEFLLSGVK